MTGPFLTAIAAAALLLSGVSLASAQSTAGPAKPRAAKAAKPATPARTAAAPTYNGNEPGKLSDYWTIEQALPGRPSERASRADTTPQLGRTRLQDQPGTVGFTSGAINTTGFSDGRPMPGLTQNTYKDSSYVGLSLSVPSSSNSFVIPVLTPPSSPNGW